MRFLSTNNNANEAAKYKNNGNEVSMHKNSSQ